MAQDILRLTSTLDFSLSLESVLDYYLLVEDTSVLDFSLAFESEVDTVMSLPSAAELEERDPL